MPQYEFHLGRDFAVDETKGKALVGDGRTLTDAVTKYPKFFEHERANRPAAQADDYCMKTSEIVGAFEHVKWLTHDAVMTAANQSRAAVDFPAGDFWLTSAVSFAQGRYIGLGAQEFYVKQGPTHFSVWHEKWNGAAMRNGIQTITFGNDTLMGYLEAAHIEGFRVAVRREACPAGVEANGAVFWDMGECSYIHKIFCTGASKAGFKFVRATPASIGTISSFDNAEAAIDLVGTDLSTFKASVVSCDDNEVVYRIRSGYGRPGGGAIDVGLTKMECGKRNPKRGQIIMDSHGATMANFGNIQMDHTFERVDSAFVMDTRNAAKPLEPYMAMVNVGAMRGWNYDTLLQHIDKQEAWASPGDYRPVHFVWDSDNGITVSNRQLTKIVHRGLSRLGVQTWNGSAWVPPYDRNAGTPVYVNPITGGTTPPPVPVACTGWTTGAWSAWGPCVGGIQTRTRTVTASPAGCTGTPPGTKPTETETQACTAPPPGGILYTLPVPVTVAATTSTAVNIAGVTKVDLSFTPSTAPNYGRIIGTGPNLPSLMVQPDGFFWWGTTAGGWTKCATTNAAKVANGVKWTGVITLPSAQTIKCIHQTDPGQGGAYKSYVEKLNLL